MCCWKASPPPLKHHSQRVFTAYWSAESLSGREDPTFPWNNPLKKMAPICALGKLWKCVRFASLISDWRCFELCPPRKVARSPGFRWGLGLPTPGQEILETWRWSLWRTGTLVGYRAIEPTFQSTCFLCSLDKWLASLFQTSLTQPEMLQLFRGGHWLRPNSVLKVEGGTF